VLEARNISYSYDDDSQALKNVSLKINDGEMAAILGKNGAGKSTLFLHFNGIHEPDDGEILIDGEKLKYNKKALIKCRQKVGIVFQNPDNQIFAPSVEEDVAFGPLNLKLPMDEVQNRVEEALKRVGMEGFEKKAPHHLSGGQKKRVAIAGILAMRPEIMILDEPTAGLDPQGAIKIMNLLSELNMEGITIVISTHDVDLVSKYVNKIFVMADGEIIDEGTPKEIFSNEDLIEKANLKLPIISELFKALDDENQINIENNDYPLTISEAKDKILELMKN
jgi:cobalt/nickel transport system ATP-binding protein